MQMNSALSKAAAAVFIIIAGQLLKKAGLFGREDYKIVAKICLNVTLPAAIIMGFTSFQRDLSLYLVTALGLACNLVMLALVWFATAKKPADQRLLPLLNVPGYQIGTFTLPYIGGVLGPYGILVTCMFDIGNALMSSGGTYAIVSSTVARGKSERFSVKNILMKLLSSTPFDLYVVTLLWVTAGLPIPSWLLTLAEPIGAANFFVAMFLIGLMIEIELDLPKLKALAGILAVRYASAAVFALIFWFCTPFSVEIRKVLAIVIFSPVSSLGPIFTGKCGGDTGLASLAGSVSIVLSIACITGVFLLTGA